MYIYTYSEHKILIYTKTHVYTLFRFRFSNSTHFVVGSLLVRCGRMQACGPLEVAPFATSSVRVPNGIKLRICNSWSESISWMAYQTCRRSMLVQSLGRTNPKKTNKKNQSIGKKRTHRFFLVCVFFLFFLLRDMLQ